MSSACPSNTASQILVDDRDPRISYSPGWELEGTAGKECNGTTHDSDHITDVAASFSFEGVASLLKVVPMLTILQALASKSMEPYPLLNLPHRPLFKWTSYRAPCSHSMEMEQYTMG